MNQLLKIKGFTLMELLIYVGIFAIAAGLFTGVLFTILKVQQRESSSTEVNQQLNFVMQTIQRLIKESSAIIVNSTSTDVDNDGQIGSFQNRLVLRVKDSGSNLATDRDPIVIWRDDISNTIKMSEGIAPNQRISDLTNSRVVADKLEFTKFTQYPGHDTVSVDMQLTYNTEDLQSRFQKSLKSAIARVSAANFDSNLLPGSDNQYEIGYINQRWKNISISNLLNLGQISSDPSGAQNGSIYYNTANNVFRGYKNGSWTNIGGDSSMVNVKDFGAVGDGTTDDTTAIQNTINYANSIATGDQNRSVMTVLIPNGKYKITSQIAVKKGVNLHVEGILYNNLSSSTEYAVWFKVGSHTSKLQLWGNLKGGVKFGELATYSNMQIGDVRLWNIGEESNKIGIKFTGYNFTFEKIEVDGGNIGIDFETASDVRGDQILAFTASTGVRITSASEHINISNIDVDSPEYRGIQIDSSHDISIGNAIVFLNDAEVVSGLDGSGEGAVIIGEYSSSDKVNNLNFNLRVQNTGGTALKIYNIENSVINLIATNANLGTGNTHPITTGIAYGSGVNNSVSIYANIDSAIITPSSGTVSGALVSTRNNNIGIGIADPTAKLDVDGAISAGSGGNKGSVLHKPCSTVEQWSSNAGWSTAQASCPANTILTGGGGNCSGYAATLHISYPSNNSWLAACGDVNTWGPIPTTAYAICCRTD